MEGEWINVLSATLRGLPGSNVFYIHAVNISMFPGIFMYLNIFIFLNPLLFHITKTQILDSKMGKLEPPALPG